jgi:sulfate permease, SulP family
MTVLPFLKWMPEWRKSGVVRADLLAGLTGAVLVLPQGLAFAMLAGMPPHYGLYAAIVPCIVAALFGSSRLMVSGPANAISLTTMALLSPLALVESTDYVALALTLSFLVGLVQISLGLVRLGKWVERVPHSVVVGFTVGAAVLIINSQIGSLLGLPLERGLSMLETFRRAGAELAARGVQWWTLALVSLTLLTMWAWRRLNRLVPAMLIAVIVGSLCALAIELIAQDPNIFQKVPAIPGAFPPLSKPDLQWSTLQQLIGPVLVMTLLASTEAMAIARAIALGRKDNFKADQEFIGQGLANVAGSFFSAYPSSGSFNRSGVNAASGAKTPLSAVSSAFFLMILLGFVSPLVTYLPLSVISALLLAVAWGLIDRRQIAAEWRAGPREAIPMVVTFGGTLLISLEWAILGGLICAILCGALFKKNAPISSR